MLCLDVIFLLKKLLVFVPNIFADSPGHHQRIDIAKVVSHDQHHVTQAGEG